MYIEESKKEKSGLFSPKFLEKYPERAKFLNFWEKMQWNYYQVIY